MWCGRHHVSQNLKTASEKKMSSVAREEAATEVVTPPLPAEAAPVYRMQLQPRPHVTFDDSIVDNEHLGRKRSNSKLDHLYN